MTQMTSALAPKNVEFTLNIAMVEKMTNGTFTVENLKSGAHRTYKIQRGTAGTAFADKTFVKLMTGQDNEGDFTAFAFLYVNNGQATVKVWRRYEGSAYQQHAALLAELINNGATSRLISEGTMRVLSSGHCLRCGRKLTTPESVDRALGPECWEKMM